MKKSKKVRIFSALEVANICGVVNQTAINWIKNDYLKAFTTPGGQYRVYADHLVDFLRSRGMKVPDELLELAQSSTKKKTVLIVDDDPAVNSLIHDFLKKKFPEMPILQAYDGFEAGKIVSDKKPGIIILDIDLPGIDGHKLCEKIKADDTLENPIIISITGLDDDRLRKAVMDAGADAFIEKPIDFEKLHSFIEEFLNNQ